MCASLALVIVLILVACGHQATPTTPALVADQIGSAAQAATTPDAAVPSTAPTADQADSTEYLEVFETVWQTVDRTFYDPAFGGVDWEEVHDRYQPLVGAAVSDEAFYARINEMLWELKVSHLFVVPPGFWEVMMPVSFAQGHTGLDVRLIDGVAVITSVQVGSPGARAGLRMGYVVQSVDGVPVKEIIHESLEHLVPPFNEQMKRNINTTAVQNRIYGPAGMPVVIGYLDGNGEEHETSIQRAGRERKSALGPVLPPFFLEFESRLLNDGIAYIRFNNFHPALAADVIEAIESMHNTSGLIIDLRGNSGGQMDVTKAIARQLITERTLFSLLTTRNGHSELVLQPEQHAYGGPLVILVDALSLSASEHFAAGLQAISRAAIVGERSPGNLLGGNLMQLPNDTAFIYPVVQISTPDGTVLEGRGVIPDIDVALDRTLLLEGVDSQLEAAIEYIEMEVQQMGERTPVRELAVPADDVTLHVRVVGGPVEENVLVAVHGGPGMSSDYMVSLEQLASEELAVVTYDQRGTGRSTSPPPDAANYDLLKYVADLDAVRQAVGAKRVHLLGHSWGGLVAMRYAAVHPGKVSSIILIGSGAPTLQAAQIGQANKAQRITELQRQGIIPERLTTLVDVLPAYFFDPDFRMPEELENLHYSPTAEQLTWSALGDFDFTAEVATIQHPVLFLWGEDDPFGLAMAKATRDALLNADVEFVVLENCGHFWHECPDELLFQVRAFLELRVEP